MSALNGQSYLAHLLEVERIPAADLRSALGPDYEQPRVPMIDLALARTHLIPLEKMRTIKKYLSGLDTVDLSTETVVIEFVDPNTGSPWFGLSESHAQNAGALLIKAAVPTIAVVEDIPETVNWLRQSMGGRDHEIVLMLCSEFVDSLKLTYSIGTPVRVVNAPSVPTIFQILDYCISKKGSDIHLSVGQPPMLRLNGSIERMHSQPIDRAWMQRELSVIAGEHRVEEAKETFQVDFAYTYGSTRFRMTIGADSAGLNMVARRLPSGSPTMSDLGLPQSVKDWVHLERGLVLVTGPTGSGKTTTLAALLGEIAITQDRHLITLEDPIEYLLPAHGKALVNQRELGGSVSSFANGLRQALRQDPDIILVGELRDADTIKVALLAAETGHLVFATTHTSSAEGAINRLLDAYDPAEKEAIRAQVAYSLRGVVSQVLVPKKHGGGRVGCFEVLVNTLAVSQNLRTPGGMQRVVQVMETAAADGMQTMDQALAKAVRLELISEEDAELRVRDKKRYMTALARPI